MAAVCLILIAIPLVAYAKSRNANPKTNTQTAQNLYKVITEKTKQEPFPTGEFPKEVPKSTAPVIKTVPQSPKTSVYDLTYQHCVERWGAGEWRALENIITRESGFNPYAWNASSGAGGLFQALPYSKVGVPLSDVHGQIHWGLNYISSRYGTPNNAWSFWQRNGYY